MFTQWIETLANHDFTVEHRPGKTHQDSDTLSRVEHAEPDPETNDREEERTLGALGIPTMLLRWKETVEADSDLSLVLTVVTEKRPATPEELVNASSDTNLYLRMSNNLYFDKDGRLRIQDIFKTRSAVERGAPRGLLVVPHDLQEDLMTSVHVDNGCMGREATVTKARQHFYFPRMSQVATRVIQQCTKCQEVGPEPSPQKGLYWRQGAMYPYQIVSLDFWGPVTPSSGYRYILSVTDLFSKFYDAFPTKHADAKTVVRILTREILPRYGVIERIHVDRGSHFVNSLVQECTKMLNIEFSTTPSYNAKV